MGVDSSIEKRLVSEAAHAGPFVEGTENKNMKMFADGNICRTWPLTAVPASDGDVEASHNAAEAQTIGINLMIITLGYFLLAILALYRRL